MKAFRYLLLALLIHASLPMASAQSPKTINEHPATQVTFAYLRNAMGQDWKKAAAIIEPRSLERLKFSYIERIKRSATIDEEIAHVRRFNCANLKEVQALKPSDFYVRYHEGLLKDRKVDQAKLDKILESLAVKLLSLAEESVNEEDLCHILVRTRHSDGIKVISSLDLVSLIKVDGAWKVTLNAQDPQIRDADPKK